MPSQQKWFERLCHTGSLPVCWPLARSIPPASGRLIRLWWHKTKSPALQVLITHTTIMWSFKLWSKFRVHFADQSWDTSNWCALTHAQSSHQVTHGIAVYILLQQRKGSAIIKLWLKVAEYACTLYKSMVKDKNWYGWTTSVHAPLLPLLLPNTSAIDTEPCRHTIV